ncbi:hypothetical protein RB628_08930 [Streptomyces sp. ADMS]|uniref:hypothetical protein n=1 Tax=Streptomyces sp. ADMS TaxID=3071415 RepID=UPI00296EEE1F|nr:hypothetical protein [Streptomyces sp. ADMS]MDW4905468.1 hypothetical protein [Streptomyces sp. ADMS]
MRRVRYGPTDGPLLPADRVTGPCFGHGHADIARSPGTDEVVPYARTGKDGEWPTPALTGFRLGRIAGAHRVIESWTNLVKVVLNP